MKITRGLRLAKLLFIMSLPLSPSLSFAATMNDYCITPAFIQQNIRPNLLLMIDNSSSMYDLANADVGNISSGVVTREPFYCKDETYSSANASKYGGYFDNKTTGLYYSYNPTTHLFSPVSGTFPDSSSCKFYIANKLCITPDANGKVGTSGSTFKAAGDYLNWLTASKFDVEKKILTGGKQVFNLCSKSDGSLPDQACSSAGDCPSGETCTAVDSFLQAESRGCVGQPFIKIPLNSDFTNFAAADPPFDPNNPAHALGITFSIRGPVDSANKSNPSRGGQTYIDIYMGNLNTQACDAAIKDYYDPKVNQATVANNIQACINYSSTTSYCAKRISQSCTTDSDCYEGTGGKCATTGTNCNADADCGVNPTPATLGACTNKTNGGASISCTTDANCAAGTISGGKCSNNNTTVCSKDADCPVLNAGRCDGRNGLSCSADSDCIVTKNGVTNNLGPCNGITFFSCSGMNPSTNGTCTNPKPTYTAYACNNPVPTSVPVGPCINPSHSGIVNTKIALTQTIQTCWTYLSRNQAIGNGDYTRLIGGSGKCDAVYPSWGVCTGDTTVACTDDAECAGALTTGPCIHGPDAILPGNPATVCGNTYLGKWCHWDASLKKCDWTSPLPDADVITSYENFCKAEQPLIIDPTDSAATSSNYEQIPALIGGMALQAQLSSIGTVPVRKQVTATACTKDADCAEFYTCVNAVCKPTGILQQFDGKIRLGAMIFNFNGSATEVDVAPTTISLPRVCSNDHTRLCTLDLDCPGSSCLTAASSKQYNHDGAYIRHNIGQGFCAAMTETPCTTNANCGSASCIDGFCGTKNSVECTTKLNCSGNEICASSGAGDHSSGLVHAIDSIRANAWTPFAEAFYNAIGYFGRVPNAGFPAYVSNTNLQLNSTDFDPSFNPSEYKCQQNFALLISDGSSTADQHAKVKELANTYSTEAYQSAGHVTPPTNWNSSCSYYNGSSYLPILSYLARHRNLADFSQAPAANRDFLTTYVVLSGDATNGEVGECNSFNLFSDTAKAGGTSMYNAKDSESLQNSLVAVLQSISAQASSGTAASILSNSEGSGANMLQAVFYPKKVFESQTVADWIGEMQNLWYFVDPQINYSTIREDTDSDLHLILTNDKIATFEFDEVKGRTFVKRQLDSNGDGQGDSPLEVIDPDDLKSIWRAGRQLYERNLVDHPRTIYTPLLSGGSQVGSTGLMKFSTANSLSLKPYLQATNTDDLIKYIQGFDFPQDDTIRSRTVKYTDPVTNVVYPSATVSNDPTTDYVKNPQDKGVGVWKLGDVISSTPRLQSTGRQNSYSMPPPGGYGDASYASFIGSEDYKKRGMVYVGANDGMLHAFNLGILDVNAVAYDKAKLKKLSEDYEDKLGEEAWAFIPRNVLPYLKYMAEKYYGHLYYIDGPTVVADVSIGSCGAGSYYDCPKSTSVVDTNNNIDATKNTWRTVLVGSMGLGGATKLSCTSGSDCVATPMNDPDNNTKGLGYSSYFALDVSDPKNPKLMWEFNDPELGYATTGPAIVRVGPPDKNGHWYAVFGSGPTGPIDTIARQFKGRSNQYLKYFVVDLVTGLPVNTIDTKVPLAFSGSLVGGPIDADRWDPLANGRYQDDAIYAGYVQKASGGGWTDGGVGRIVTNEGDAATWTWSPVIVGTGPVVTGISRLQDRKNRNLWLYFGSGRYYYRVGADIDDFESQRTIYGIKEPCYNTTSHQGNMLDKTCSEKITVGLADGITDQSTSISSSIGSGGWKIDLDKPTTLFGAERIVTDTVTLTNGVTYFTSFKPTADVCGFGGNSYVWALDYKSGARPSDAALFGKALIQLSTGEFKQVDLATTFTDRLNRRMGTPMTGKPPADAPPILSKSMNKPVKRILHIQER